MAWYEKVLGLEDKEKNQEELDDMYNATGNSQKQVEQQGEEEKAESTKPARAERKRAGEDVSGEQHDHTDPFKQRVGVVPDDIANHDFNKGMENDVVDDKPATTTPTGNEQVYNSLDDIYKELISKAEEGEKETQANEAELKRTAKRRMLLAGIADAANSFHQAYAYARGIKAMNDNKGYAKEMRKELREDLDWLRKNKDRVLNYRAKAAEIQKTIAALKNQDKLTEERLSKERRAQRESDAKIKAYEARANKDDELANLYMAKAEAVRNGDANKEREIDAKIKVYESQKRRNDASANASNARAEQIRNGTYVEEEKTDETGMTSKTTRKTQPLNAATSGNSNAGNSKSSEDNTPPSKRPKGNNDSTPPSRRK